MGAYYDEIEIEDMAWDEEKRVYHYPCPCGDRFEITRRQLADCEDIATCPSCSLIIRVIFDPVRVRYVLYFTLELMVVRSWTLRMSLQTRTRRKRKMRRRRKAMMITLRMLWRS